MKDESISVKTIEEKKDDLNIPQELKNLKLTELELLKLFNIINQTHFNNEIPPSRVKWSERIGQGKHGHRLSDFTVFDSDQFPPVIRISRNLLENASIEQVAHAMLSAMAQIWLWLKKKPWGHTFEFYEKCKTFNYSKVAEFWT